MLRNLTFALLVLLVFSFSWSCQPSGHRSGLESLVDKVVGAFTKQRPLAIENGKIFKKEGRKYLYGGEQPHEHFDITNCSLKDDQFHYGIGREKFPALIEPQFISVTQADTSFKSEDRFLLLQKGPVTKAYSVRDLTRHEVVNDMVDGEPVMAVYCILADLGAIYHRKIGGKTFTFALTGYTYFDNNVWDGMDGFVLWDRETESMWWPLTGEAVSGRLKGTPMRVMDQQYWSQTTWEDISTNYKNALILEPGQDFMPPKSWEKYQKTEVLEGEGEHIAPRWGENRSLSGS